jgi:hypothetical protein
MQLATIHRILAVAMLAGFGIHHYAMARKPAGVGRYHELIRAAAAQLPTHIGEWVGEDVPVPARSLSMLRPNVMISRRYTNVENGRTAGVLLVHCSDAHSMAGHFPLRCYPAQGWILQSSIPRDWMAGDLRMTGTEYAFTMDDTGKTRAIVVANVLFLPGGKVLRDMNSVARTIAGAGGQASGSGQMQVYFDANITREERDEAITSLMDGYGNVIRTILSDVPR